MGKAPQGGSAKTAIIVSSIGGLAFLLLIILGIWSLDPQTNPKRSATNSDQQAQQPAQQSDAQAQDYFKYEIVNTVTDKRYDGGPDFYVLIEPVDISSNTFKDKIKTTVKKIVNEKGKKISLELHDNRESLNVSYKQYGDRSLGRPRTAEEEKYLERHYIAAFDGELESNTYKNTLMFFPAAFTSAPEVGQYVETIEFNP